MIVGDALILDRVGSSHLNPEKVFAGRVRCSLHDSTRLSSPKSSPQIVLVLVLVLDLLESTGCV